MAYDANGEWRNDPIEDGIADLRAGHHGSNGRKLAAYIEALESLAAATREYRTVLDDPLGGNAIPERDEMFAALDAVPPAGVAFPCETATAVPGTACARST